MIIICVLSHVTTLFFFSCQVQAGFDAYSQDFFFLFLFVNCHIYAILLFRICKTASGDPPFLIPL